MTKIRGLTICQPYASMIARGEKPIENRSWPTAYRGPLLIHAGKSKAWMSLEEKRDQTVIFGAIVAVANLAACLSNSMDIEADKKAWGRFSGLYLNVHANGPWCWILEDVMALPVPVPCPGAQGLWRPDSEVLKQVIRQQLEVVGRSSQAMTVHSLIRDVPGVTSI